MNPILNQIFGFAAGPINPSGTNGRIDGPSAPQLPSTLPLGSDLTCIRHGIAWSFRSGRIFAEEFEINRLINDNPDNAGFFMGVAEALNDYRKRVLAMGRQSDQIAKFEAVVDALLMKIFGKLKKFYDQKMSGLAWTLQNGQLILNGINVRSFLSLYRIRKTDKARKFLKGLRDRLADMLENRCGSPDNERVREAIQSLYQEVQSELGSEEAASSSRRLLPYFAHVS